MTLTVDVIVPVYGRFDLVRACLESLAGQTVPHRVIVVDDGSPDETLEHVRAEFGNLDIVVNETNRGFAATCNRGIAEGQGDIVVLCNTDVVAEPTMLERLVETFADPRVGSATPLLLRPDGRIDAYGLAADVTMAGHLRLHGAPRGAETSVDLRLLGPYGAVAAYRRSALEDVGVLDEGLFMYGEELDLALRLSASGWLPAAAPTAVGTHIGGASAARDSAMQRERSGFSRGYMVRAYGLLRSRSVIRTIATECVVCVRNALVNRDLAAVRGRLRGWRAAASTTRRTREIPDLDRRIGFFQSMRLRARSR